VSDDQIVRAIVRPSREAVAELAVFGVATLHEASGRTGLLHHAMRPLVRGQRLCGPAITVLTDAGDNLMLHAAVEVARAGDVIVLATRTPSTHGAVGELLATQARAHGVAGMVLDSGVRDTAAIIEMGFPIWSRAVSVAGTTKERSGSVNVAVLCGGAEVHPGDVVVADDDGVMVVRADEIGVVIEGARRREASESVLRGRYAAGELSLDVHGLRDVVRRLGVSDDGPPADDVGRE